MVIKDAGFLRVGWGVSGGRRDCDGVKGRTKSSSVFRTRPPRVVMSQGRPKKGPRGQNCGNEMLLKDKDADEQSGFDYTYHPPDIAPPSFIHGRVNNLGFSLFFSFTFGRLRS